jgi:hypothetical protein
MRTPVAAFLQLAAACAAAATARAEDEPHAPLGVAAVVADQGLPDPALRGEVARLLCEQAAEEGFACAPPEDVAAILGSDLRPGPDVLGRLAEELDLPYAVAVVLYPGSAEGEIDADVFLQVRDRETGIYRSATDTEEDAAETVAETAAQLLVDARDRGFARGGPAGGGEGGPAGAGGTGGRADDGLIDLAINETLQGIAVAYAAVSSVDVDDWRIIGPTLLMGGGAGIAAALLSDYYLRIDVAQASMVAAGGWWGLLEGGLLAKTVGESDLPGVAPWALLGWGVGLGTGITLAATVDLTKGDVALVNSSAAWGTFAGAVIAGTILGRDIFTTSTDYDFALPFGGLNVGLVSGIVASRWVEISRGRMALIDLSGLLGVLLGGSLGTPLIFENPSGNDKRWYSAVMLGSAALGLTVGALLTSGMDDDGPAAAAMIDVEPAGDVHAGVPVPRPWVDPTAAATGSSAPLGLWFGIAEGSW